MTTFQWPFATSTISSDYGPRPGVGKGYHDGTDFAIARGTAIPAVADGMVTNVWIHPDAGPYAIDIDHGGGVHSQYWHCDSKVVTAGQRVTRGQKIGTVGSRGLSTGPHLHFEIHAPGSPSGRATWPARAFYASRGVATDYAFGLTTAAQKALQGKLKSLGLYNGDVDGKFGEASVKAMQTYLKNEKLLPANYTVDGAPGMIYGKALQALAKRGGYTGKLDGQPGAGTSTALSNLAAINETISEEDDDMQLLVMQIKGKPELYVVNRVTGKKWHIPNEAYLNLLRNRGVATKETLVVPQNEFNFFLSLWNNVGASDSDIEKKIAALEAAAKSIEDAVKE